MMNESDKRNFEKLIESLRQYQRYELVDENNKDLLNKLYVDPLDNNTILDLALKDNTTVLVGRKGTGKSTIFMRMQNKLRESDDIISCYIDVKSVFDKAKKNYNVISYLGIENKEQIELYSIQRKFILDFINELIKEIEKSYVKLKDRLISTLVKSKPDKAIIKLREIRNRINDNKHLEVVELEALANTNISAKTKDQKQREYHGSLEAGGKLDVKGAMVDGKAHGSYDNSRTTFEEEEKEYNRVFARIFDLTNLIEEIKEILTEFGIRKLFVVLDDYSEVEQASLRMFCDLIVNSLNNNSENFIKLKISAYPGRVELGELDLQKIDIRYLDYYQLYNYYKRDDMEQAAINYTKRIIENRLGVYTGKKMGHFFNLEKNKEYDYYSLLFKMSLNVVRHLGLILDYAKDISISQLRKITITDLEDASGKFYQERLAKMFAENKLTHKTYNERVESFQLQELLVTIVNKSKDIKKDIRGNKYTAKIFNSTRNNAYSSHFHIKREYEEILSSLELNFFVSKYNEMVSKTKKDVSIYSLNYGLCSLENIRWGKPAGNEFRTYFIESPFNYGNTIIDFLDSSKKVYCSKCGFIYELSELKVFEKYGMNCMRCQSVGSVKVEKLSDSYDEMIRDIENNENLIEVIEYKVLTEIGFAKKFITPKELAKELDTSYQKIGRIAKNLREKYAFIDRNSHASPVRYRISKKGREFIS